MLPDLELNLLLSDTLEGWEVGGRFRMGDVGACGWLTLMYGRDQHNIVKQFSFH